MKLLCEKKFWCVIGIFFYVSYVFRINEEYCYENVFAGVKFNGDVIFYAGILLLFGLVLFYLFMDTEKYINGYGVLYVTRHRKRSRVAVNIILNQIKGISQMIFFVLLIYLMCAGIFGMKAVKTDITQFIYYVVIFYLVCLNLSLWEAIFEIIFDARIAIVIEMVILMLHIFAGEMIYAYEKSRYLYLLCYTNIAMTIRNEMINLPKFMVITVLVLYALIKAVLIVAVYGKKDIIQENS